MILHMIYLLHMNLLFTHNFFFNINDEYHLMLFYNILFKIFSLLLFGF